MLKDMYIEAAEVAIKHANSMKREAKKFEILYNFFKLLGLIFHSEKCIDKAKRYAVEMEVIVNHFNEAVDFASACQKQAERFVEVEVEEP